MTQKIFHIKFDHVDGYVRADSEESLKALLIQYGVEKSTITRAPGKSKLATSVIALIRDKLRKNK